MIIGPLFLSILVTLALLISALTPIVLLVLLFIDWRKKRLW